MSENKREKAIVSESERENERVSENEREREFPNTKINRSGPPSTVNALMNSLSLYE